MISQLVHKVTQFVVTLRFSILSIFITLFILTTLSLTFVSSLHYIKSVRYVAHESMRYASATILRELGAVIDPAALETSLSARLFEEGVLKDEQSQLIPFTINLTRSLPFAVSAYWGDRHGDFIYSKRMADGGYTIEIYNRRITPAAHTIQYRDKNNVIVKRLSSNDLRYDPRVRPWYIQSETEKKTIWTDVYRFKPIQDLGITTASPVFMDGQFLGAFGLDINLESLAHFVRKQKIKGDGFAFIINQQGDLIAWPDNIFFSKAVPSGKSFSNVYSNGMSLVSHSLDQYIKNGKKSSVFSLGYEGETYMVKFEPVPEIASYGWLIGVVVPERDLISEMRKMHAITLSISLLVLILGVLFVSALITNMIKPIKLLIQETEHIKNFDLDKNIMVQSKIKEIIFLRDAIHSMKVGLRLFQKYIPKILVKQLIELGEDVRVGGVRKHLAVFFSDVENFATLSEKTDPNLLMQQMSDYFEILTQIIIEEQGTIDKYIGDSIMAFWGAPLPVKNPCQHAANTALRCQKKLEELNDLWEAQGKARVFTRIGIHVGEAIVGNLGSTERLNYTAIGDTINIASRLETINKIYKTKIIVSEAVYEEIKDYFVLRLLDCVVVKGRTQSSYIYELLSDDINTLDFDVNAYSDVFAKGFKAFQHEHWEEALSHFHRCVEIYPSDTVAPFFIQRCSRKK